MSSQQPMPADYFVLRDNRSSPLARLLVPLDQDRSHPMRAELYASADRPADAFAAYVEQAQRLLNERYRSPDGGAVPLYTLDVAPESGLPPAQISSAPADYFTLDSEDGEPLASLLAPLDRSGQPSHAELYVAADLDAAVVDESINQAHRLLEDRYGIAAGPNFSLTVQRVTLRDVLEVDLPADRSRPAFAAADAGAIVSDGPVAQPPGAATPKTTPRNSRLPMAVIGVVLILVLALIVFALARALRSGGLGTSSATGSATELSASVVEQPAAEEATSPVAEPTATPSGPAPEIRETYCIWPGETLSEIAANAGVSEEAILGVNPDFTGQAGTTILLPPGATFPRDWTTPPRPANSIEDSAFGESGYYLSYDNRAKRVALSFDIGYADGNQELMELLAERGIRGTFFMLGGAVENHPELIAQVLENGHELGNHSYTHDNMLTMTRDQIAWELSVTEALVQNAYPGATTKDIFRAPFGAINDRVKEVADSQGYHLIGWTVDSGDWTDNVTQEIIYDRVTRLVCPGAMIAMHDVNTANGPALVPILDFLDANGYEYVTVTELLFPDR